MKRNAFPSELDVRPEINQLAKEVSNALGCSEPLTMSFIRWTFVMAEVFEYKQGKYGPGNIAAFADAGVLIRANDKVQRLINLGRSGQTPTDETIEDSWGDLATYSVIALMCRAGQWPTVKSAKERAGKSAQALELLMTADIILGAENTDTEKVAALRKLLNEKKIGAAQ